MCPIPCAWLPVCVLYRAVGVLVSVGLCVFLWVLSAVRFLVWNGVCDRVCFRFSDRTCGATSMRACVSSFTLGPVFSSASPRPASITPNSFSITPAFRMNYPDVVPPITVMVVVAATAMTWTNGRCVAGGTMQPSHGGRSALSTGQGGLHKCSCIIRVRYMHLVLATEMRRVAYCSAEALV